MYVSHPDNSVIITRNGVPTSIEHTNQLVIKSNDKFIDYKQCYERIFSVHTLFNDVNIPVNSSYKHVELQGCLFSTDIVVPQTVSINDQTFTVTTPYNFCKVFTQPLTLSDNNKVVLHCRVRYIDPV